MPSKGRAAPKKKKATRKTAEGPKATRAKPPSPKTKKKKAAAKGPAARKKSPPQRPAPRAKTPPRPSLPAPAPSERLVSAVAIALPNERPLTPVEETAMAKVASTARRFLVLGKKRLPGTATAHERALDTIRRIGALVDEVRRGSRPAPENQDIELGLGVLWGEQLRPTVGWSWVHLTYPDGFASYALVSPDRSFSCFPLNRLSDLLRGRLSLNTSVGLFEAIAGGVLPPRREGAYLVVG